MNNESDNLVVDLTKKLLGFLGFDKNSEVEAHNNDDGVLVSITSNDKMGLLIGKNGQNINAIEHLIRTLINKKQSSEQLDKFTPIRFSLDINDYKKIRSQQVINTARDVANRVSQNRRSEAMYPMNSYERRLIHSELASYNDIETESVGEEPRRRVVIKPTVEI
ncbi:MAG: hypothetical protein COV29_04495 [Candidatus Yanofskybacteria bacterium CG10_big_fil_rev_8_21_14_0_10_36_16]|uniref:R3H domain-containing protein n=1 Tax=Candidatus Yanofskybacteria bacterium CG10_big_fil_rev_8_21_14_0_10_36_16 TaxID=1975096 RepID=A0A2J0Q974_9BACT|nr:MAG: hypothetical protein COV29_04495 [Candidatus Yanofskybacteria bacterium CG10_big_fil_rev_8_21_14_0_10_36_16]